MSTSRRHLILQALETLYAGIVAGENDYTIAYSLVTRKQIDKISKGMAAVMGIYPTEEGKASTASYVTNVALRVVLEMNINRTEAGDALPDLLENALNEAERRALEDQTLGGLCYDINIVGSETELGGFYDNVGSASLTLEVKYRHHRNDPAVEV